ncbi:hypothetical protein PLANPX_5105 [Lacipirellula parvula]|uniref:Uncharacterized protein n=1 Tax=Lacipirellula parvula TaxID=2650471 RepID=A0A5K7XLU1_9BACT|nr:hypothetical protein PLANPX_5105 [Lacipirellula parvula]
MTNDEIRMTNEGRKRISFVIRISSFWFSPSVLGGSNLNC